MARWVRVSQVSLRLLPRARNVLFRLSPFELLSGRIKGTFDDGSIVPESHGRTKNDSSETMKFRPLTEDEKKEFENSLDDDGKRILRELSGSVQSVTLIPTVDL